MSERCIMSDDELAENELDPLQDCLECRLSWDHCVDKSHSNYQERALLICWNCSVEVASEDDVDYDRYFVCDDCQRKAYS